MADEVGHEAQKRKLEDVEVNWPASELEQALEKRRKLEEAEPYNDEEVRQKAKEIGIGEAMRSSASDVSKVSQNAPPRGLSSAGDESSEFVSADEDDGVVLEDLNSMPRGTEDEILADSGSGSDEDADGEGDEQGAGADEAEDAEAVNETTNMTAGAVPAPEARDDIADMIANADERVARIMEGYPLPSLARQADASSDSSEEEGKDSDAEEEGGEEETQVVQDSMVVGADAGLATPPVDVDSGHGSMEDSQAELGAVETAPESADDQPLTNGSRDRMSAVEETVRQIKAERSGGAKSSDAESLGSQGVAINGIAEANPGAVDGQKRKKFVAQRKENKKQRKALALQQMRDLASQIPQAAPQAAPAKAIARLAAQVSRAKRAHKPHAKSIKTSASMAAAPKRKRNQHDKRRARRVRRAEMMQLAAREDPEPYIKMLQEKVVFVPELPGDADELAQRDRKIAVRKSRKAGLRLMRFEELVARISAEEEANEELGVAV